VRHEQPAAGAEGVEMFTTPMQQLPISQDSLNNLGERLMDRMRQGEQQQSFDREQRMTSFLTRYADQQDKKQVELLKSLDERAEARLTQEKETAARLALQPAEQKENAARLALQPAEQKKRTAEEVTVKVSAATAAASAQAPAAVVLSTVVALASKDILKYPEQVHQDEVVKTAYAASAGTQEVACTVAAVGEPPTAFAPVTAPGEKMDSKEAADVDPWITQFLEKLDAKGEAPREQPVQLERMKEQQAVQSTRDHKLCNKNRYSSGL